jgi:hypothetical protein
MITKLPLENLSDEVLAGTEKIDVIIEFSLEQLLNFDIESLNDYVEERILEGQMVGLQQASGIEDIAYEEVGFCEGQFLIKVSAFLCFWE